MLRPATAADDSEVAHRGPSMARPEPKFPPPTVSVIVVNYNYAAFLRDAVESVVAQTYPHVECVVVDDCSTDDSPRVLAELARDYSQIRVVTNETNGGQSAASLNGLAHSTGAYVIFLDADDYLYPACVETHIKAHLSLRTTVGFTSVDMVQVRDGQIVTTSSPGFGAFVHAADRETRDIRGLHADVASPHACEDPSLEGRLLYVDPRQAGAWPWSPTSGNCFRRDALRLVTDNDKFAGLRSCTDCYLLRGVACVAGSALIDLPLFAYRLHGSNDFVTGAHLNRIRPYDLPYLKKRSNEATRILVDYLIDQAETFWARFEGSGFYRDALDALDDVYPPICETGHSYVTRALLHHRDRLRAMMGAYHYDEWLAAKCLPPVVRKALFWCPPVRSVFGEVIVPLIARSSPR